MLGGANKSLQRRLLWGFVGCATLLWLTLVTWGLYTMFTDGKRFASIELERYAQQVLAMGQELHQSPKALKRALSSIEQIENLLDEDEVELGDRSQVVIQVWIAGQIVSGAPVMLQESQLPPPTILPTTPGFQILGSDDSSWWTATAIDPERDVVVRICDSSTLEGSIGFEQAVYFFLPLMVSLPLLLLPAWFMTRFGLRPLGSVVTQLEERVDSGALEPLRATPYRELNPVVLATNNLMHRLDLQRRRERALVADVAHELKTPLAIVQMNAERLQAVLPLMPALAAQPTNEIFRVLEDLVAGVGRSDRLIHQLLRMARLEQGVVQQDQLRRVDLAEFVRERAAQSEPLARAKSLQLLVEASEQPSVLVYIDAFSAIVDNLLDNAIKYSGQGGKIFLSCSIQDVDYVLLVVDEGQGIANVDQEQAFSRFARLGPEQQQDLVPGAGLGLSIVKQAVLQLHGKVRMRNLSCGQGLEVEVRFPLNLAS